MRTLRTISTALLFLPAIAAWLLAVLGLWFLLWLVIDGMGFFHSLSVASQLVNFCTEGVEAARQKAEAIIQAAKEKGNIP